MSCENLYINSVISSSRLLDSSYLEIIRGNHPSAFTRKRKVLLPHLFMQMLATTGTSQKNEISNFYDSINEDIEITQTGYFNARMKFNPEALRVIFRDINRDMYSKKEYIKLNGYYVTAIDGSDFLIPRWRDNKEVWDTKLSGTKHDLVMGSVSTIFDVINKCILDVCINQYKYSEKSSASEHLDQVKKILPHDAKMVCIFDRGYPSIRLITQMLENSQYFVMRLKSNDFTREVKMLHAEEDDQWIDIEYDRSRTNDYREDRKFRTKLMNTIFHLRFVKIKILLDDGSTAIETLLTNLPTEEFDADAMKELYHLRWDIETCYRSMKSQLKMEEFSGYREELIKQDIYACAFVYNMVSDIICSKENLNEIKQERYQHEMAFNRNYAAGALKHYFLKSYVYFDRPKLAKKAVKKMKKEMIKHLCPIRQNRNTKYSRGSNRINKHKMSYRYSY